ncbi:MAG: glycoside hydrolase family 75 protein [Verrucomicrobiota bacterium]
MSGKTIRHMLLYALTAAALGFIFITSPWWSPMAERVHRKAARTISPPEVSSPQPKIPPLPDRFYPKARMMTFPLKEGLDLRLHIISEEGEIASIERHNDAAYALDTRLTYRVPTPATTLEQLEARGTPLSTYWPNLSVLLETAQVSPSFHSLYERKIKFLEMRLDYIRELPHRHNMYDCDSILELTTENSQQQALLIQADMDIVTDGSDSDRTLEVDTSSPTFQPFTSYNWAKRGTIPNPLIGTYQAEANQLREKLKGINLSQNDQYIANRRLSFLKKSIEALKYRSSLVASLDPFIVVPVFMVKTKSSHQPSVGDYCLIFYRDLVLPGIVGDTGPNSKIGEASLKIAQKIDPAVQPSASSRPVSSLGVTYLIFINSAEKTMEPPDLKKWHDKCSELFADIGGKPEHIRSWIKPALKASNPALDSP